MSAQIIVVTASRQTQGPGLYLIYAASCVLTLEDFRLWADPASKIIVKDMTGAPSISVIPTVVGGSLGWIDEQPSAALTSAYEALEFLPYLNGNEWIVT